MFRRRKALKKLRELENKGLIESLYRDWKDYQANTWIKTPEYQWRAWVRS